MSQNITIRLTPEEKAELERLNAARWEASLASRRAFCAVASYERWVLERAFAELPVPPGYASEYLLMMQTLTPDGTVEGYTCGKVYRPTKGCSNEHPMLTLTPSGPARCKQVRELSLHIPSLDCIEGKVNRNEASN